MAGAQRSRDPRDYDITPISACPRVPAGACPPRRLEGELSARLQAVGVNRGGYQPILILMAGSPCGLVPGVCPA